MRKSVFCLIGLALIVPTFSLDLNLTSGCKPGQYKCANNGECLDAAKRCDHVTDCTDGADEIGCEYHCKSPHMQQCRDGHCIAVYFFCDGKNDCGDWSDEFNCTQPAHQSSTTKCTTNTFKCEGTVAMCIPLNWVCDGTPDCDGGKDELHCTNSTTCNNGFQCGSKECILNQWVCDGTKDCADGSDEEHCGPDSWMNHSCMPEHGWFSCPTKGVNKCMPLQRACDSISDCDNRSDEGNLCASTTNNCTTAACPSGCKQTPNGPVCQCPVGLRLSGKTCVDIDECAVNPPVCSQGCSNSHGSFECTCITGYTLSNRNNKTCIANGPEPIVLITTDRDIRSFSVVSKEYGLIQSGISQSHSVTSDYEDGFVFWTEKSRDKAGIFKSLVSGSNHQYVVSVGVETVEDLAVDWVARHIYFTDSGRKHIVACDLHGTICTVVVSGQLDKPRALALYIEEHRLFWSDWGSRPHIGRAGMDGSERKDIITTDIMWPNGLTVDETIQRIFWSDAKLNRLESSTLDGKDRIILPVEVSHPYAIDVFEDMIYWSDPVVHEVQACNKFTGKGRKVLMKEASLTPTGVHIHHPSKQRHVINTCWNIICSHLCLLSPSIQGFQCACPHGMTLNPNNRTCDPILGLQSSVIIATYTDLYQLTHHQIGRDSVVHLPTRIMDNIGALAFSPLGHSIVYSDLGSKVIYSMHLETFKETILFDNADSVEGLDVDPYTENVYWTEVSHGTVVVGHVNHDGLANRVVIARGLHSPKGITLAPELGLMFIVEGRISHVINVWHMDGTNKQELVQVYGTVSSMAYDKKHLYFSDSLRGTLERIAVDGHDRDILRSHQGSPVAMDVNGDSVFWLTQYSSRINWLNKAEPKATRGFIIDAGSDEPLDQYRIMAVVDHFDYTDSHVCLGHTGGCSDICVPTPSGSKCVCPLGKELSADKHSCHSVNCTASGWFKCQSGCIPSSSRCDGIRDCQLGEDELGCRNDTTETSCTPLQFKCHGGGCIARAFVCDGDFDCYDRSDEPETCEPHQCFSDEILCPGQRHCIPRSARCDGQTDCADGSDEQNCTATTAPCSTSQFFCKESSLCIPLSWVCDKDMDCPHGEDERDGLCSTASLTCPPSYVRCPPRMDCIPRMTLCNGIAECDIASDLLLCANLNRTTDQPDEAECSTRDFRCYMGSNECIPKSSQCDCKFDCRYGEDEEGCMGCDHEGFFRCPGEMRFINTSWLCDGINDCSNGADELASACPTSGKTTASPSIIPGLDDQDVCDLDEFECTNGRCVPFSTVCDGVRNCADGTDEGPRCNDSCTDSNGHCPQLCIPGPRGPTCQCHPGYVTADSGRTCLDLDECLYDNRCSQFCNNTKGSYRCSCAPGYQLEKDEHTCKVMNGRPTLIVATSHSIEALFNNGYEARQLVHSDGVVKDIGYHDKTSTLYWVTSEGLHRNDRQGKALVHRMTDMSPSGLALDRATGNVYVSGMAAPHNRSIIRAISVSKFAHVDIIVTQTIITDIAIDGQHGLLFWSEHVKPHTGRIIRSTMDGSSTLWLNTIVKIVYPVAMTLDPITSRIYWADLRLQSISSADYSGQHQRQVVSNTNGLPLSISFFENRISWTNLDQEDVRSQALDEHVALVQVHHERVGHILTVHSILEPELANPCASSECGNGLCLLRNASSFECMCPQGVEVLSKAPFKCRGDAVVSPVTPPTSRKDGSSVLRPEGESSGRNPDDVEVPASPGVTVASILICLSILTVLAVLGWVYYKRWRKTIGSPLKFRFRNALGMSESTSGWEESVDYSDRKMLYLKSDDKDDDDDGENGSGGGVPSTRIIVDQNDNRTNGGLMGHQTDSAYASQQSLVKHQQHQQQLQQHQQQHRTGSFNSEEHQPQQLLPASYSMKDKLLASEL